MKIIILLIASLPGRKCGSWVKVQACWKPNLGFVALLKSFYIRSVAEGSESTHEGAGSVRYDGWQACGGERAQLLCNYLLESLIKTAWGSLMKSSDLHKLKSTYVWSPASKGLEERIDETSVNPGTSLTVTLSHTTSAVISHFCKFKWFLNVALFIKHKHIFSRNCRIFDTLENDSSTHAICLLLTTGRHQISHTGPKWKNWVISLDLWAQNP